MRFTTDIPYLPNWGTPLLIGPGSILVAHTAEECVRKSELTEAVSLYTRLARTLLARADDAHARRDGHDDAHAASTTRDEANAGGAVR
jgi:hypothetical protein